VQRDGGYSVTLVGGVLIPDGTYIVHVGPLGTEEDPDCYSGIEGSGSVTPFEDGSASIVIPPLPVGGPYAFTLRRLTGSGDPLIMTDPILTVTPQHFRSGTFRLRRYLMPWMRIGNRSLDQVRFPQ
jgi:hypothetical protein